MMKRQADIGNRYHYFDLTVRAHILTRENH